MDAVNSEVAIVSASSAATATVIHTSPNAFNVSQNNNNNIDTHANTHSGSTSLTNKTTSNVISSSSSSGSSNSNSSCSSSSTSSNSSGYGSTTTTPTNNYDLQQRTPTTTPIPTTPAPITEHIIPVATVAALAPFYNESITTHNLETQHVQQHHHHHSQQQLQQVQQQQQHLLQANHPQFSQNHLQTNLQQQQHHQYLSRQQYYAPYDYQQTTPTHNLSSSSATSAIAPYNMIVPGSYELSSSPVTPSYGTSQYNKASSTAGATNYERNLGAKVNPAPPLYSHQLQEEHQQPKIINQQTQSFTGSSGTAKQRSSSLIISSASNNTSKPQAAATPFYANPTPFYDNFKHKMPLEYHDAYGNPPAAAVNSYHQQQKYYAAAKSQLKEASYGSPAGLNSKALYSNNANFFPGSAGGLNLSSATYDKYMYTHTSAGYPPAGHLGNEIPPEVSNYRKPVVANAMNSPSWPWGIDYATGSSRSIPPPTNHLPTATVAPTHATHLTQNPSALARDPYYLGPDKYGGKYDKYTTAAYQQSYVSPPANSHLWSNTTHASNLTQLNERHLLTTGPPALNSHGLHTTPYFPNNPTTALNNRQSCCSQPYQTQSCYYPPTHVIPQRLPHSQTPTVAPPTGGYLAAQQTLGQSPHLNALTASCKYGGVLPDYASGNKIKNSNDLYLNSHHYDNNLAPHNFGYGSAHSSQQLYANNAHQSMAHGSTSTSLLTNDPMNANPTSYTNDLSLTTSNFDNYHTHHDAHPSQQALAGIHSHQHPPPIYGPTVAKRALLDYRKPIQPQPPPTIAEDCYTTLTTRDHYIQQDLLNTPETTTTFGEYEAHQINTTTLPTLAHATEALVNPDGSRNEGNKNLSLRDFIANWNDDEDEYQNNEEMNFDQDTVIDEVLQTAPVEQKAAVLATAAIEEVKVIPPSLLDTKTDDEPVKTVESFAATLNDPDANQYINLPDIVIDIEKSNNVNNSIITPITSPATPPQDDVKDTSLTNLTNFDVEKELDELNQMKPAQQELAKDLSDIKDSKSVAASLLSPGKNLTTQLSFEDLNLEPANRTVLNTITTRLANNHSSELNEQYFKDIEGYESGSSRHSNESAFEKEYETFINKITCESSMSKISDEKTTDDGDKESAFVQNVHEFSKFYKRKRKLKENEFKPSVQATQVKKKLKTNVAKKVNNSNFPQAYTKKSRNRLNKSKQRVPHKRKPVSAYYKIIHSIRRFGLYREKRVREYMTELKDKHLPLIKRQSIKNYTHEMSQSMYNAKSLKGLCIVAINTDEFRQILMLTEPKELEASLETEEKHICTDPTCETCEVIKSLMQSENFETALMQQATENNDEKTSITPAIFCVEGSSETMTILEDRPNNKVNLDFPNEEHIMISSEIQNVQYSKEKVPELDTKELEKDVIDIATDTCNKSVSEAGKYCKTSLQKTTENAENTSCERSCIVFDSLESDKWKNLSLKNLEQPKVADSPQVCHISANKEPGCVKNIKNTSLNSKNMDPLSNEKFSSTKRDQESESEDSYTSSDSDSSSTDTEDEDEEGDKIYNSNNESSNTATDAESDAEDATINGESNQSHHSKNIKLKRSEVAEVLEADCLYKRENEPLEPNIGEEKQDLRLNDIKSKPRKFSSLGVQSDVNTNSDSEDENISRSPQRIVIRITKSLIPNDQSLRVENIFGKSSKANAELDKRTESEMKEEDIAKEKCLVVSSNLSDALEKCVSEFSNNRSNGALEDNDITAKNLEIPSAPLKLILRINNPLKEQTSKDSDESHVEHDENAGSGSGNADISPTEYEINTTEDSNLSQKSIEPYTDNKLQDNGVLEKIPSPENQGQGFEEFANLQDKHDKNVNNETDIISITLKPKAEEEEEETRKVEKPDTFLVLDPSFNELEKVLEKKHSTSSEISYDNKSLDKSLEPSTEVDSKYGSETIPTAVEMSPKPEISEKVETLEKTEKSNIEKDFENENDTSNQKPKITLTLKPTQEDSDMNKDFQQKSKFLTEFEHLIETPTEDNAAFEDDLEMETKYSDKIDHQTASEPECNGIQESERKEFDINSTSFDACKKENFPGKSTEATIEVYNLTDSETEDEDSAKDIHFQSNGSEFSTDSESFYDSEHETDDNDDLIEAIKKPKINYSQPILISDNESLDTFDTNKDIQTTMKCKDSRQDFKYITEFSNSSDSQETNIDDNYILKITNKEFPKICSDTSNDSFESDVQLTKVAKDKPESVIIKEQNLDELSDIDDTETSLTNFESQRESNIKDLEKMFFEYSSASEDIDEEMYEKLCDPMTHSRDDLQVSDQTNCDKKLNSSEYHKNKDSEDSSVRHSTNIESQKELKKAGTLVEESVVIEDMLLVKSDRTEPETVGSVSQEIIENSKIVLEVNTSDNSTPTANKTHTSEDDSHNKFMLDSEAKEPGSTQGNSNILEETKILEDPLKRTITEDETPVAQDSSILVHIESSSSASPSSAIPTSEQQIFTAQINDEKSVSITEQATEESNIVATQENKKITFEDAFEETNLDGCCRVQSINKSESKETQIFEDETEIKKNIVEPISGNGGTSLPIFCESSVDKQPSKASDENSTDIDRPKLEEDSQVVTKNVDYDVATINNTEMAKEQSNIKESCPEVIVNEQQPLLKEITEECCCSSPKNTFNENYKNISKATTEELQATIPAMPQSLETIESKPDEALRTGSDLEPTVDNCMITIENSISELISDKEKVNENMDLEENCSRENTQKPVADLKKLKESSELEIETNSKILKDIEENSGLTKEFEFKSEIVDTCENANREEIAEKTRYEEKFASKVLLESTAEVSESITQEIDNVSKVCQINKGGISFSEASTGSSKGLKEPENNEIENNDELGIKSQNTVTKNSNTIEAKESKELFTNVVHESVAKVKTNTEMPQNCKEEIAHQNVAKDDKLTSVETPQEVQTQPPSFNHTSGETNQNKDCIIPDELSSGDFFGFKHQTSFEDESEDFHGFEDLEEVIRIRQEIENLDDDSAANDGFRNNLTLNRQIQKSPTSSLNESTFSEINEFEALEKELSQHQPETHTEDEYIETEKNMPTESTEDVSSNDIEHVKQMLQSDEEQQTDVEDKKQKLACISKDKSVENSRDISKDIISSANSIIPKLSDLCRAALNSSLNSKSNLAQQHIETSTILVEQELSVEEALAEMYRQAGVLLSDPEECDNDAPTPGNNEAHDVLLLNLQEILNSDNNEVYVLQCDMNENVLDAVPSTEEHQQESQDNEAINTERVNTVQIILDTQNPEPHIHIISSDSESEVIILSDDESDFSYRPFTTHPERVTIPFINDDNITDSDSLFDISTIHHEEIVPDNLKKFLQEEFYKYLHEKYVQRNISKYYHANRVLKKYKKILVKTNRQ